MPKFIVRKFHKLFVLSLVVSSLILSPRLRAEVYHLADGTTLTGSMVSTDDKGFILKLADGSYGERTPWAKLSQADLKQLENDPKLAELVEPYIELTQEDMIKRTEIDVKEVPHMPRPPRRSVLLGLASSGLGLFALLMIYGANIYAAYEISIFRARPAALVCGVAAVAPVIGPIIFLSMPTQFKARTEEEGFKPPAEEYANAGGVAEAIAAETAVEPGAGPAPDPAVAAAAAAAKQFPPPKIFARGQFMFNRRFFETQMPHFFGVSKPEGERDLVLWFKTSRGEYVTQRIMRISANDLHLLVQKKQASEEVTVPFVEVQEVRIKHKDAP
jgi:hypothetical protein